MPSPDDHFDPFAVVWDAYDVMSTMEDLCFQSLPVDALEQAASNQYERPCLVELAQSVNIDTSVILDEATGLIFKEPLLHLLAKFRNNLITDMVKPPDGFTNVMIGKMLDWHEREITCEIPKPTHLEYFCPALPSETLGMLRVPVVDPNMDRAAMGWQMYRIVSWLTKCLKLFGPPQRFL
ncbi:unnamed protein product [Polarella glacialis]|uniref:Uncharacterized protein n=1 Tax=Polarella glacialis TaxID=89957 RepID=A0A813HW96_POLGL|nr:unnamed protein product [Polarella glacialis]